MCGAEIALCSEQFDENLVLKKTLHSVLVELRKRHRNRVLPDREREKEIGARRNPVPVSWNFYFRNGKPREI